MCYNILLACLAFFEKILKAFKFTPVSYCLISHNRQQRDGSENLPQETKDGNQINDRLTVQCNPLFETIVKHFPQ